MIDLLPHTLTKGVAATREGIEGPDPEIYWLCAVLGAEAGLTKDDGLFISWPDAAELLRYREGKPWCFLNGHGVMTCDTYYVGGNTSDALHRLAAILCDDAEAFRVLHWCVTELGGES